MEEKNDYYVYEHIRPDTKTCFYVGKGKNRRAYYKKRNAHHDRIVEKHGMEVRILYENLTQEEAYELEQYVICNYVFNKGYNIDIIGYTDINKDKTKTLTNSTFGGDGGLGHVHDEEWRKQHSKDMSGENNPMYGVNVWDGWSDEKKIRLKKKFSELYSGENNPMYGISPKERMSEEKYLEWREKQRNVPRSGKDNPNFGNDTLKKKLMENPELKYEYYPRKGLQNGMAREIYVYDENHEFVARFDYIKLCCEWMIEKFNLKAKVSSLQSAISTAIKNKTMYHKLYFELNK